NVDTHSYNVGLPDGTFFDCPGPSADHGPRYISLGGLYPEGRFGPAVSPKHRCGNRERREGIRGECWHRKTRAPRLRVVKRQSTRTTMGRAYVRVPERSGPLPRFWSNPAPSSRAYFERAPPGRHLSSGRSLRADHRDLLLASPAGCAAERCRDTSTISSR